MDTSELKRPRDLSSQVEAQSIFRADSYFADSAKAVAALDDRLQFASSSLTVFFCSPAYDLTVMATALRQRAAGSLVVGCTTAGEIGTAGYQANSISGFSLPPEDFHVSVQPFRRLRDFSVDQARHIASQGLSDLESQGVDANESNTFALLLIDGLSRAEEPLTYKLQDALGDIPLIGGSAGDGLDFQSTYVFCEGTFQTDTAVLALIHCKRTFEVFREQHFEPTDVKLVVTEADPDNRVVYELNGEPAVEELARVIGVDRPESLTSSLLAANPLMIRLGGEWFIRSAHSVIEGNALKLFCACDEGQVLTLGRVGDLPGSLERRLTQIEDRLGPLRLTIACDCILRRLELEHSGRMEETSKILTQHNAIGFSTYGEQFGKLHINQTLTGIAIA